MRMARWYPMLWIHLNDGRVRRQVYARGPSADGNNRGDKNDFRRGTLQERLAKRVKVKRLVVARGRIELSTLRLNTLGEFDKNGAIAFRRMPVAQGTALPIGCHQLPAVRPGGQSTIPLPRSESPTPARRR